MIDRRWPGAPFAFRPLGEEDVHAIRAWRDLGPYGEYDPAPADPAAMLDSAYGAYAIATPDGELVGFCRFGPDARVSGGDYADERPLDLDFGVRPNLTGRELETLFVRALLGFARRRFTAESYRAIIAESNRRPARMLGQRPSGWICRLRRSRSASSSGRSGPSSSRSWRRTVTP